MELNKVIIATHVFTYGNSQALRNYFLAKKVPVLFIGHPLFGNVFTWIFGAIDTLWQVLKARIRFDLYIGSNNLNAFVGIFAKKLGLVKKVVYYTQDYSPQRFSNFLLNSIYHGLDYYCLKNADLVWNNTSTNINPDPMMLEREKRGISKKYRNKQVQVPDGTDKVALSPFNEINRYEIGFVGHLREGMGLELLIDSFPEITKQVPSAKLLIIGIGPIEEKLRQEAKGLNIEFTGFMGDILQVYERLSKCAIGVAPYEENTISQFTDPGKVKVYLSVGLPMVITKVPHVACEIDSEKCGIAINYNKDELIEAAVKLLKDETILKVYRDNTLRLAKKYSWDHIFDRALSYL